MVSPQERAKCRVSPPDCICGDGAHHWKIWGHGANPLAYCIHCGRGRKFQAVFGASLFEHSEQHAAATRAQAKEAATHTSYDSHGRL
ncbi:hypothetical protein LCGC14_2355890 [marine sediment metagenome]|uniref:Uncharacterized protein n=1 Tax=marine sediment metagenome TaxID=412755 RepID=A0A0F9EKK2_9ZZZZ